MEHAHPSALSNVDYWQTILGWLQHRVTAADFQEWLKPSAFSVLHGSTLFVRVPNSTYKDWLQENFRELIGLAIEELQLPIQHVEFSVEKRLDPSQPIPAQSAVAAGSGMAAEAVSSQPLPSVFAAGRGGGAPAGAPAPIGPPASAAPARYSEAEFSASSPLNTRYVFSTFVVGSSNQFAHAAATRVVRDPGRSYNPLFLYGGVGLGKTHLMQAIGHDLRTQYPHWKILYLPAERFINEMVQAMAGGRMAQFHQVYRNVDALLIDDVQFLSGKERTLEEFFHTFNTLRERQRPLVLTSDRPPKEITNIDERLRSRYASGLIADIQPPDLETRQAILMKMAEMEGFDLPEKIALFIATNVKSNIRELEGSLVRVIAYVSLTGAQISENMARQALADLVKTDTKRITIEVVQKAVCEEYKLKLPELKARDNSKRVVVPRQVAMWLARKLTDSSLPEIARAFGDKHHTTVLHSLQKIEKLKLVDKEFNRQLNKLLSVLE